MLGRTVPGEECERGTEQRRDHLRHEQQPPAVEAVGREARPRREESTGPNCATLRTPRRNGECVSR